MTSRWFRLYADAIRNPKVASLSDKDFRLWIELLSVAAENGGDIPDLNALKHILRRRLDHLSTSVDRLISIGLIDCLERGYTPHSWNKFQYKSDASTDRVQKFREKRNVSVTPPETEAEDSVEGKPSTAGSSENSAPKKPDRIPEPVDIPKAIFDTGVAILVSAGGNEKSARSLIGKWRQQYDDGPVLTILAECQVKRPQQPSEWIIAALRARYDKKGSSNERISPNRATSDIAREVAERLERKAQPDRGGGTVVHLPRPRSSGWPD